MPYNYEIYLLVGSKTCLATEVMFSFDFFQEVKNKHYFWLERKFLVD